MSNHNEKIHFDVGPVNYTFGEALRLVAEDSSYAYTLIRVTPAGWETFADCARRMKIPFGQDACNADTMAENSLCSHAPGQSSSET
jgi:hypothetical protein